ncbi:TPA: metal-dependent hydrolase [Vibrio parahaemolyticus]|uniref:metal-dependent hydrolase n=1 Tax=Vibrio campbellii TaxID=680 RepID=UPI001F086E9F|nr:metal-dependent hydrolase [Vibrio campbellii]UMM06819.1 metal-dependent hydrolase [Vibrio campbellii]
MLGRNHVATACAGWLLAEPYLVTHRTDLLETLLLLLIVGLGAMLPDADHPDSLLGRRVKFISVPLSYLQGDRGLMPWSESTHSRGITHSIWALGGCIWLLSGQTTVAIALAFGFVAHLIGDALTPAGVRLLWPLSVTFRSPVTFRTGGFVEYLFTMILVTVAVMQWLGIDVLQELEGFLTTHI